MYRLVSMNPNKQYNLGLTFQKFWNKNIFSSYGETSILKSLFERQPQLFYRLIPDIFQYYASNLQDTDNWVTRILQEMHPLGVI